MPFFLPLLTGIYAPPSGEMEEERKKTSEESFKPVKENLDALYPFNV